MHSLGKNIEPLIALREITLKKLLILLFFQLKIKKEWLCCEEESNIGIAAEFVILIFIF